MKIHSVQGAHLTAADKRNIRAVLALPEFRDNVTYHVGRKWYRITAASAPNQYEVTTIEPYIRDNGDKDTRSYRSKFNTSIDNPLEPV